MKLCAAADEEKRKDEYFANDVFLILHDSVEETSDILSECLERLLLLGLVLNHDISSYIYRILILLNSREKLQNGKPFETFLNPWFHP